MYEARADDPRVTDVCEIAASSPLGGCFVEFGVFQGGTAIMLAEVARKQGRALYLYDTFTGIPFKDDIDNHRVGDFSETDVEEVRKAIPDAIVVQGIFPDSLVSMPPVAFVHVDCDQYRSVKDACLVFPPLMVPNGIMVFDDYGSLPGATKAVKEHFQTFDLTKHGKALVKINVA